MLPDGNMQPTRPGGLPSAPKKSWSSLLPLTTMARCALPLMTRTAFKDWNANATCAQGYAADHKDIELLRLRNFTLGTKLRDDEVVGAKGLERIAGLIETMVPFVSEALSRSCR